MKKGRGPGGRLAIGLKRFYHRFLRVRGTPRQIALGLALGVFVGMSPFMGLHTVIAVMIASMVKWSKIAAGAGVFFTNPLTAPLIYPLTYRLGAAITGFSEPFQLRSLFQSGGLMDLVRNSPVILVDLIIGGIIVGLPLAAIAYLTAFRMITRARAHIERRKALRASRRALTSNPRPHKQTSKSTGTDKGKSCMD